MSGFAETLLYLNEWKFKIWGAPASGGTEGSGGSGAAVMAAHVSAEAAGWAGLGVCAWCVGN